MKNYELNSIKELVNSPDKESVILGYQLAANSLTNSDYNLFEFATNPYKNDDIISKAIYDLLKSEEIGNKVVGLKMFYLFQYSKKHSFDFYVYNIRNIMQEIYNSEEYKDIYKQLPIQIRRYMRDEFDDQFTLDR